jgi:hypothetical protein
MTPADLAWLYPDDSDIAAMVETERLIAEGKCLTCKGAGKAWVRRGRGSAYLSCPTCLGGKLDDLRKRLETPEVRALMERAGESLRSLMDAATAAESAPFTADDLYPGETDAD